MNIEKCALIIDSKVKVKQNTEPKTKQNNQEKIRNTHISIPFAYQSDYLVDSPPCHT